jgi:hypothetical protein
LEVDGAKFSRGICAFRMLFISGIASAADTDQNASDILKANIFEVFVGATIDRTNDVVGSSIGATYIRRFGGRYGIGGTIEYTGINDRGWGESVSPSLSLGDSLR